MAKMFRRTDGFVIEAACHICGSTLVYSKGVQSDCAASRLYEDASAGEDANLLCCTPCQVRQVVSMVTQSWQLPSDKDFTPRA